MMILTPRFQAFSALSSAAPRPVLLSAWSTAIMARSRRSSTTSALLCGPQHDTSSSRENSPQSLLRDLSPRAQPVGYMAGALILHFGGYEFLRNSCLALFTSSEFGFANAAAFPLASGLISPFAIVLLWGYGRTLERDGPRGALRNTTLFSILFVLLSVTMIRFTHPSFIARAMVGLTFLFQNSYQHWLYMQHWAFMSSIASPEEGSLWFPRIAACSSLVGSVLGSLIPWVVPHTGLLGMIMIATVFMVGSLLCGERAYELSERHGCAPNRNPNEDSNNKKSEEGRRQDNRFQATIALFRRTPTLQALLGVVIAYQCLSTTLNVAFVRSLKDSIPDDVARSAYTGRIYSLINATSTAIQLLMVPSLLKKFEQADLWRTMPLWPLLCCGLLCTSTQLTLPVLASAFCVTKIMDYSFRTVTYIMVYQPLDFEGRYLGKETIGLFGGRFGKSGMALLLSGLTAAGLCSSLARLCQIAFVLNGMWLRTTWGLASIIPTKKETQKMIVSEGLQGQEAKRDREVSN